MPIRIPDDLPARKTLEAEGVMVMDSTRAARQDIRPLQIGLLNLMPNKERTETQFTRLIGATPLQVDLTLVRVTDHKSKNTSEDYLTTFYSTWEEVRERKFDGFIVTGAPIANMPFEEVQVLARDGRDHGLDADQRAPHHVHLLGRAGGAASLPRRRALPHGEEGLRRLPPQDRQPALAVPARLFRQPDDPGVAATTTSTATSLGPDLEILIDNDEIGVCMLGDRKHRALYMLNHLEYDNRSLADEYERDVKAGPRHAAAGEPVPRRRHRPRSRRTAGAATRTCCSRTGSTRSTRRRRSSWTRSAANRLPRRLAFGRRAAYLWGAPGGASLPQPPTTIADELGIALGNLADAAAAPFTPTLRLGVTGLSRAGKTIFITALVHNLLTGGRLPGFAPLTEGRFIGARLAEYPDAAIPRFAYEQHLAALTGKTAGLAGTHAADQPVAAGAEVPVQALVAGSAGPIDAQSRHRRLSRASGCSTCRCCR